MSNNLTVKSAAQPNPWRDLWVEWFDFGGDPWEEAEWGGQDSCFFCGGCPEHKPDCVYVKAERLLDEETDDSQYTRKSQGDERSKMNENVEYTHWSLVTKRFEKDQVVQFPEARTGDILTGVIVKVGGLTAMLNLGNDKYIWVPLHKLSEGKGE